MQTSKSVQLTDKKGVNISPITDINSIYYEVTDEQTKIVSRKNLYNSSAAFPIGVEISTPSTPLYINIGTKQSDYIANARTFKWNSRLQVYKNSTIPVSLGDIIVSSVQTENIPGTSYQKIVARNYNLSDILYNYAPKSICESSLGAISTGVGKLGAKVDTALKDIAKTLTPANIVRDVSTEINSTANKLDGMFTNVLKSLDQKYENINTSLNKIESENGDNNTIYSQISVINNNIEGITSSLSEISNSISEINPNISQINTSITSMNAKIVDLSTSLDYIKSPSNTSIQLEDLDEYELIPYTLYRVKYDSDNIYIPDNPDVSTGNGWGGYLFLKSNSNKTFDGNIYGYSESMNIVNEEAFYNIRGKFEIVETNTPQNGVSKYIKITYMEDENGNQANYDFIHIVFTVGNDKNYTFQINDSGVNLESSHKFKRNIIESDIFNYGGGYVIISAVEGQDQPEVCDNIFKNGAKVIFKDVNTLTNNVFEQNADVNISNVLNFKQNTVGVNSIIHLSNENKSNQIVNNIIGNDCKVIYNNENGLYDLTSLALSQTTLNTGAQLNIHQKEPVGQPVNLSIKSTIFDICSNVNIIFNDHEHNEITIDNCVFGCSCEKEIVNDGGEIYNSFFNTLSQIN